MYDHTSLPMPKLYGRYARPEPPYLRDYTEAFAYDSHFRTEGDVRRALAGYYGLCSFIDDQVGLILQAIEAAGLGDDTRIVYTSDHGDNLGTRGLWGKSTMYEESVGVPLIVAGPGIPEGGVNDGARSLTDLSRFILASTGCETEGFGDTDLMSDAPGVVISEYHATGSRKAAFMLRRGPWKYVHYEGYPPQLFDLAKDPEEATDLGCDPAFASQRADCDRMLREICDYERVNQRAFSEQAARIEALGGREAILATYDHGYTLPPVENAAE